MTAHLKWILGAVAALLCLGAGGAALAQCCQPPSPPACNGGCQPPPQPPCCVQPPSPPVVCCQTPPTPPSPPVVCCTPPSPPPVTIVTPPVVAIAIAGAQASAQAGAAARATSQNYFFGGGGGGGGVAVAGATSAALNISGAEVRRVPYQMRRRMERVVVIQAVCIDDRAIPHAASQLFAERDVRAEFVGELYRCIAGTHMQVTIAEWHGRIDFNGGETINCQRGEALWYEHGNMTCRPQTPQRDCFERSRLRLWGAGVKVLRFIREEVVTAYREERVEGAYASGGLVMDGGVGGVQY